MIDSDASAAFDLSQEPDAIREKYGKGLFGQGCLMARRLVERGVPFIEVSLECVGRRQLWLGHAREQLRGGERTVGRARRGLGFADVGPCGAGPVGVDDDCLDGRVRPHAADQWPGGAGSFSAGVVVRARRRRHRRRSGLRSHDGRRHGHRRGPGRGDRRAGDALHGAWACRRRRKTTRTRAGRSRLSMDRRSKNFWLDAEDDAQWSNASTMPPRYRACVVRLALRWRWVISTAHAASGEGRADDGAARSVR